MNYLIATLEMSDGGARYALFCAVMLPALLLAISKSSYLVDYYVVVLCLNRFVRRWLDWSNGEYDTQPISSLLPMVIGLLMGVVVLSELEQFSERHRRAFYFLGWAIAYGAVNGLSNGTAMFYAILEYTTNLSLLFYGIAIRAEIETLDRWISTLGKVVVGMAIYGWYQWAVWPPWDSAWIEWSRMWTSMGYAQPYKTAICSTMESRGPFAWFIATASIAMLILPQWRKHIGLPGALLAVSSILPTTVRSAWGILLIGLILFGVIRGGQGAARFMAGIALTLALLLLIKVQVPETEYLFTRLETIGDIANDGSFQGRAIDSRAGLLMVLQHPFGFGLGSSGMAVQTSGSVGKIMDNGLLEIISSLGLPGTILLILGFRILASDIALIHRETGWEHAALALCQFTAGVAALAFSNWFAMSCAGVALMTMGSVLGASYSINEDELEPQLEVTIEQ